MADDDGGDNGTEPPFSLSRDFQGNAVLILGDARHNLGPWEEAAKVMADWLGQIDLEG